MISKLAVTIPLCLNPARLLITHKHIEEYCNTLKKYPKITHLVEQSRPRILPQSRALIHNARCAARR